MVEKRDPKKEWPDVIEDRDDIYVVLQHTVVLLRSEFDRHPLKGIAAMLLGKRPQPFGSVDNVRKYVFEVEIVDDNIRSTK